MIRLSTYRAAPLLFATATFLLSLSAIADSANGSATSLGFIGSDNPIRGIAAPAPL